MTNKQYRFMAFRQFVAWAHHYEPLGKEKRIVVPSCVVVKIKKEFPPAEGEEFTGFIDY